MEGAVPRGPGRWALPSVTHTFNSDTVALSLHTLPHHQSTLFAKLSWDPRGGALQVQQVIVIPPAPLAPHRTVSRILLLSCLWQRRCSCCEPGNRLLRSRSSPAGAQDWEVPEAGPSQGCPVRVRMLCTAQHGAVQGASVCWCGGLGIPWSGLLLPANRHPLTWGSVALTARELSFLNRELK